MALTLDRLKNSLFALVKAAVPRVVYASPRIARVVSAATAADGSTTLDVVPEDPDFPAMSRVPLFHGLPGVKLTLTTGTRVVVEFSEADPARPLVRSWAGGEAVADLELGGAGAVPGVLAPLLAPYLDAVAVHTHNGSAPPDLTLATVPPVASAVVKLK